MEVCNYDSLIEIDKIIIMEVMLVYEQIVVKVLIKEFVVSRKLLMFFNILIYIM